MTRKEWYDQYRQSRVDRKKNYKPDPNAISLNEAFKDCYTHFYGDDEVTYRLICKYEDKVSPRLLYEKKLIRAAAKERGKAIISDLICKPSRLMSLIRKDDTWTGGCLVVPTTFKS